MWVLVPCIMDACESIRQKPMKEETVEGLNKWKLTVQLMT